MVGFTDEHFHKATINETDDPILRRYFKIATLSSR